MERYLRWTAVNISRRRFLHRTLGTAFGVFAGVAAGSAGTAYAADPCYIANGGSCGACNCNHYRCVSGCSTSCQAVTGLCPGDIGGGCWNYNGHLCCDCVCRSGSFGYYCWCYG